MKTSYIWGIIIIFLGLALLLNNLGITDLDISEVIVTYWPVIFIIWGLDLLLDKASRRLRSNLFFGTILIVLGFSIIGRNLELFYFDFSVLWNTIWPLVLIFIGINILRAGAFARNSN